MWLRRYEVGTGGVRAACWDESNGGLGCLGQEGTGVEGVVRVICTLKGRGPEREV